MPPAVVVAVAALALGATTARATGAAPAAADAGTRSVPAFTPGQLAAYPLDGWLTNGGDLSNQRYSPLALIDRGNVSQLKARWRASLNGSGLNPRDGNQAQPIVYDGVIYVTTGDSDAFAVDL
ncbi:MAG TPA: hypothetical protein VHX52_03230 [Steroidobacteraceae bacterium]|nr:hypothetical protein [Steroidobacteraceae bacterium]